MDKSDRKKLIKEALRLANIDLKRIRKKGRIEEIEDAAREALEEARKPLSKSGTEADKIKGEKYWATVVGLLHEKLNRLDLNV